MFFKIDYFFNGTPNFDITFQIKIVAFSSSI